MHKFLKIFPENDNGCIEYKWNLVHATNSIKKKMKIATQMLWRVNQNEDLSALYVIGVHDDGFVSGISKTDLLNTIIVLMDCANIVHLGFSLRKLNKVSPPNPNKAKKYWAVIQIFGKKNVKTKDDCLSDIKIPNHIIPDFLKQTDSDD